METIVREHVYDNDGAFDILFISKKYHHQNRKRRAFVVCYVCHRDFIERHSRISAITLPDFQQNIFQNRIY